MTYSTSDHQGPIARAHEGMRVVDAAGTNIGQVQEVSMGDPQSVTSAGQGSSERGVIAAAVHIFDGGDQLSPQAHERLARLGYVRIDTAGMFEGDRYAASDQLDDIVDGVLYLTVEKDQLLA